MTIKTDALTPETIATLTDADIDSRIDFIETEQQQAEDGFASDVREKVLTWLHRERDRRGNDVDLRQSAEANLAHEVTARRAGAQWYLVTAGEHRLLIYAAAGAAIEDALKREGIDGAITWSPLLDMAKLGVMTVPYGVLRILNEVR